jgi:rfaE bifunctional protein nucleotidyltransferase chain/domain
MSASSAAPILHLAEIAGRTDLPGGTRDGLVLTNGCFDLLHEGHVRFLEGCAALGARLVVGLNDDAAVTVLKGNGRPAVPVAQRAALLAAIRWVDTVVVFADVTADGLIRKIRPDVYAKGADYDPAAGGIDLPEAESVGSVGARLQYIGLVAGASTTGLLDRLRESPEPAD